MIVIYSVLDTGSMVTIDCDVLGDPATPGQYAGEYVGRFTVTLQSTTALATITAILRQEAASLVENAIRGQDLKRQLSTIDLGRV